MAAIDATYFEVYGQKFRVTGFIVNTATGNPITGGLTGLATSSNTQISKDGAAFVNTTNVAVEIGTSGYFTVDLTAAEMAFNTVIVRVLPTNASAREFQYIIRPIDLRESAGHWLDSAVVRPFQALVMLSAFQTNKHTLTSSTETVRDRADTINIITGSVSGLASAGGTVTRNKMS